MKLTKIFYIALVAMVFTISCNQDFLNTEPLDKISSEATWSDRALSEAFIYNVYSYLHYGGFQEEMLASMTDEAMFAHGRSMPTFNQAEESPSNLTLYQQSYRWGLMWQAIRQANTAIERLPTSTFAGDDIRDRLLGEAYFLRAYYYHQLVRTWGGVPLIKTPYGLDDDYTIARSTWDECVTFIIEDLDQAATLLDGKGETAGRTSTLAAMALKARILLYAASDLHHGPTAAANSSILGSYSNLDVLAYPGGDRNARWQAAKTAAEAVLNATSGYKLDLTEPVSLEEGKQNYVSLSMGGGSSVGDAAATVELIFQRTHTALYTVEDNWPLGGIHFGINNGPNGYHNWAGNTPIQQLVDDYEMMDGSKFDWDNAEHSVDPYANRDPRMYASILYDGADWKPRPSDVAPKEPANQIQTGYYDDGAGGIINGLDTRESPVEDWNGSRSHYYVRKFIDPDPGLADNQSNAQVIPWPFIRYTEMAFIYAEACIELGQEAEAIEWINKIRFRSGMPAISDSGDALMDRLINERRIELAYEEHRYYDCRRWMIAPETLGRGIKAIDVQATLKPGATPHVPYIHDKSVYDYTYQPVDNTETETRQWDDKMYYRPFSRDEVSRNDKLVQNPGYE